MYQPSSENEIAPKIFKTAINGLWYIQHNKNGDNRGFFSEITLIPDLETVVGFPFKIQQINQARSMERVIRGIHCENWNKLVTVTSGSCFCAIADVKKDSSSYKVTETFMLGDGEGDLSGSLFISKGLGNSLCVVRGPVDYLYAVDALYRDRDKSGDQAVSLFDPELNIDWPMKHEEMIISDRDQHAVTLAERE